MVSTTRASSVMSSHSLRRTASLQKSKHVSGVLSMTEKSLKVGMAERFMNTCSVGVSIFLSHRVAARPRERSVQEGPIKAGQVQAFVACAHGDVPQQAYGRRRS